MQRSPCKEKGHNMVSLASQEELDKIARRQEQVELLSSIEAGRDRSEFANFDDLSLNVMQRNNTKVIQESTQNVDINDMPPATLLFDVRADQIHLEKPNLCKVNFIELCRAAWAKNGASLPSSHIVLMDLVVDGFTSTMDQPVRLCCLNANKVPGSFVQSTITNSESLTRSGPCLCMIEGHTQSATANRNVYTAGDFVKSKTFRSYHQALAKDIMANVTSVSGAHCVEYLSPWAPTADNGPEDEVSNFIHAILKC